MQFRENEPLTWQTREGDNKTLVNRPVKYIGKVSPDGTQAEIAFGTRILRVPVAELHRPEPPARPWYLPEPIPTPRPPEPPTEDELARKLAERRRELRVALTKRQRQREAVKNAEALVDRASRNLTTAQAALREYSSLGQRAVDAAVAAIRSGKPKANGHDYGAQLDAREKARHGVEVAQSAHDRLAQELAVAGATLAEHDKMVRKVAAQVVAAVLEIECEVLRDQEMAASRYRALLTASAQWWPDPDGALRLGPAAAALLQAAPPFEEPIGRRLSSDAAAAPFKDLYNRLLENADAELRSC